MRRNIIIGVVVLLLFVTGLLIYQVTHFHKFIRKEGDCGMSLGPIYGDKISIEASMLSFEKEIGIPNGKLGLMNLSDSKPPKLIKLDKTDDIVWAFEFKEDTLTGIPHFHLSEIELIEGEHEIILYFNNSYGEHGKIYLTKNYEHPYMCISPL